MLRNVSKISVILFMTGMPLVSFARGLSEVVQEAKTSVQEINSIAIEVDSLLQQAQGSGNSVFLQCISTKQASISALQDISEMAMDNIQATSNMSKAEYEHRKITLSLSKVRQFGSEASKCARNGNENGNENGMGGDGSSENAEISVDETNVDNTISDDASVDEGTNYSFDSTSNSTSSDVEGANAESTSPGGGIIDSAQETSPY